MAEKALSKTFETDTNPSAYDVRLLVQRWDGEIYEQELELNPAEVVMFKSQAGLVEIDTDKLTSEHKVEDKLDDSATYYDYASFAKVVTDEYNNAMTGAVNILNDVREEIYGTESNMQVEQIDGVWNINDVRDWGFVERELESTAKSLESNGYGGEEVEALQEQVQIALQNLQNIGPIAETMANTWFGMVKVPGPGIEPENQIDFDEYKVGFVCPDTEPASDICAPKN